MRGARGALAAAVLVAAAMALIIVLPVLDRGGVLGVAARLVYAPMCHQLDERSLHVGGIALAVCARCTGLAFGALAGLAAGAWLRLGRGRRMRIVLAVVAVPTMLDVLAAFAGGGLDDAPRALLALPLGLAGGLVVAQGLGEIVIALRAARRGTLSSGLVPEDRHG
jgi:uncharacterized membrane protein